jgi:hypothetical protein
VRIISLAGWHLMNENNLLEKPAACWESFDEGAYEK